MKREALEQAVRELLDAAKNRKTEQGILVYTSALTMLSNATSQSEVDLIRDKLINALNGIESHGYLTDTEYAIVGRVKKV